jgi:hypothetical protein
MLTGTQRLKSDNLIFLKHELVAVGLGQKRNAKLEPDREYGDVSRNMFSSGHHDGLAVVTVE